ncbi:unnamed protein product [Mytilus edulis]|uniref:Uncharacterized protein n=1 Tax=Mytilus edulis TaxID=6550 RepID=A0A8S3RYC5_MYTED|nr:unnamed protein product [Mytilus edulis]
MNITRSRTWFRGPEQELISIDGVSFRKSKYLTATYKEYFSMTIRHFSKEDMKCEYTCYYGTDNYAKINLINESYESVPTNKTKDINYKLSYSQLNVFVCLEKVHPIPTCSVWFKQKYLSAIPPTRVKKDDLFYKAEFNITYEVESSGCELLTVICTVGSKRDVLIDETICHDQVS